MKITENALNILTTKAYKGIGNAWVVKNLAGNDSIEYIVNLLNTKITGEPTNVDEFQRLRDGFEKKIRQKLEDFCDGCVAWGDSDFPAIRGKVKDSAHPVFLYYKGDIDLLSFDNKNITVIGLLNPEGKIEERERQIVIEIVKNDATIVSGLAFGCDSISHQQALDSNGKTVAILPSPLNNILPSKNIGLAYQIVDEGGLLVTEYGNDFKSQIELNSRYVERDRLQALFSDTVILAASYSRNSADIWQISGRKLDSGARHAMSFAREYGIGCAVMYNEEIDKLNPMFDLNREIIRDYRDTIIISDANYKDKVLEIIRQTPKSGGGTFQSKLF